MAEAEADSKTKDELLGRLAVEQGYLTSRQLDEAREAQRVMQQQLGVEQPLSQVLIGKGLLDRRPGAGPGQRRRRRDG